MLKNAKRVLSLVLCALLIVTAVPFSANAAAVKLNKKTATVSAGKTVQLKVKNTKKSVKWSTSDKKVATVSKKGLVKGVKDGKATITAKIGKNKYTCKVTVKACMNVAKKTLTTGASYQLSQKGLSGVKWSSSDTKVATVNSKGKVTAKKAGTATITAKAGKKKVTCKITVVAKLNVTSKTLKEGESYQLKLTGAAGTVKWSSSATDIVSVTSGGKITAEKAGKATITAKDGSKAYTVKVTVQAAEKKDDPVVNPDPTPDNPTPDDPKPIVPDYENMDYTVSDLSGESYAFLFKPNDETGTNSASWDAQKEAFHLINQIQEAQNTRAFTMDTTWLANLMEKTNAESISFEFTYDGQLAAEQNDAGVYFSYQDANGEWYKEGQFSRTALSNATDTWVKKEFTLADIPKNEDGTIQAPFLMNTVGGLYVRNVTVVFEKDYTAPIQGKDYTFFIKSAENDVNTVTWDDTLNAFHLINNSVSEGNDRGFVFDMDYISKLVEKVNAASITYEYKWDGQLYKGTSTDSTIYSGNYPDWWGTHSSARFSVDNTEDEWRTNTIRIEDIPEGKAPFIMNAMGGLYIRNIKVVKEPGNGNYLSPIQGEEFTFFFEKADESSTNTVEWDAEKNAFHLKNNFPTASDGRAFLFSTDYLTKMMTKSNAESITFEFQDDGERTSYAATTDDQGIYTSYYPGWWDLADYRQRTGFDQASGDTWKTMTITLADIPKGSDGKILAPFIMNTVGGLYIRNITVKERGAKFRMDVRADKKTDSMSNLKLRIYNHDASGVIGNLGADTYKEFEITAQNAAYQTIEIDLDWLLDADGKFKGFSFMTNGYKNWAGTAEASESFSVYINNLRTVDKNGQEKAIEIADHADDFTFTQGDDTGLTGGNKSGAIEVNGSNIYVSTAYMYRVCKIGFTTPIETK